MRTKGRTKEKTKESPSTPYSSPAGAMKGGVGRNSGDSSPAQHLRLHPALLFPLPALPELPFRHLTPCVGFPFHSRHCSSHICRCEKVQQRLTAPLVGQARAKAKGRVTTYRKDSGRKRTMCIAMI